MIYKKQSNSLLFYSYFAFGLRTNVKVVIDKILAAMSLGGRRGRSWKTELEENWWGRKRKEAVHTSGKILLLGNGKHLVWVENFNSRSYGSRVSRRKIWKLSSPFVRDSNCSRVSIKAVVKETGIWSSAVFTNEKYPKQREGFREHADSQSRYWNDS